VTQDSTLTALGWPGSARDSAPGLGWPSVSRETEQERVAAWRAARSQRSGSEATAAPVLPEARRGTDPSGDVPPAPRPDRLDPPRTTRVLVVANQKGGVGKTTTAVNMAAALAQLGMRVLVVDLDPQGNASTALSIDHAEGTPGIYDVLIGGAAISSVVVECKDVPGLCVVPATISLAGAEIELVSLVARETRLRRALTAYLDESAARGERIDYVFIDCPPSLGLLTVNALTAAEELLIPIQCEYYAMEGLGQLLRTLASIQEHLNPVLRVGAIVLTMYDARTRLAQGVADEVRAHFSDLVLSTAIPRSVRISEAPSHGQTVVTYDPMSVGSLCYVEAAAELARQPEREEQR
jgi:chromosome partitioning protein